MTTTFTLILILVSIGLGAISFWLAKNTLVANSVNPDGYKPVTMGFLAGSYMLIAGLIGASMGYFWIWVAIAILAVWIFATKHTWTSVAIVQLLPLATYGVWLISKAQGGAKPTGKPIIIHICVVIAAVIAIVIDNRLSKGRPSGSTTTTGNSKYSLSEILRTACYVAVLIAAIIFIVKAIIAA